jgi:hypothetical protein
MQDVDVTIRCFFPKEDRKPGMYMNIPFALLPVGFRVIGKAMRSVCHLAK